MVLMAFDDDQEEVIEFIDTFFFNFLTIIIIFMLYRYSIHYFSFLESTASGSRSILFLTTQFRGDFLALFSMLLRFYALLLRLNIYDLLDDCLDCYYIFIGDFDDDEYLNELFFLRRALIDGFLVTTLGVVFMKSSSTLVHEISYDSSEI